jgi:hypothetical protein
MPQKGGADKHLDVVKPLDTHCTILKIRGILEPMNAPPATGVVRDHENAID